MRPSPMNQVLLMCRRSDTTKAIALWRAEQVILTSRKTGLAIGSMAALLVSPTPRHPRTVGRMRRGRHRDRDSRRPTSTYPSLHQEAPANYDPRNRDQHRSDIPMCKLMLRGAIRGTHTMLMVDVRPCSLKWISDLRADPKNWSVFSRAAQNAHRRLSTTPCATEGCAMLAHRVTPNMSCKMRTRASKSRWGRRHPN